MNKRRLKIAGGVIVLLLALSVVVLVGGGLVYAAARTGEGLVQTAAAHMGKFAPLAVAEEAEPEPGVVIASVVPDGPAAEAGLARGDILLEIDGEEINHVVDLMQRISELEADDEITLTVLHGDAERRLAVTVGERDDKPYLGIVPCGGRGEFAVSVVRSIPSPGAIISRVIPDSPADEAGLEEGDIVTSVDGEAVGPENDLADLIAAHKPGDTITLEVERPGEEPREVTVKLDEHPESEGKAYLGVKYLPVPPLRRLEIERQLPFDGRRLPFDDEHLPYGEQPPFHWLPSEEWPPFFAFPGPGGELEHGVVVRDVAEDSPAAGAGVRAGDIITAIDDEPVEGPKALTKAVAGHKPGDEVSLTIYRYDKDEGEGEEIKIEVTLGEDPDEEGAAYLGVLVGGFFRVQHIEEGQLPHLESDDQFFDFDFDGAPPHLEFHFPPGGFDDSQPGCCGDTL